ncbi:hypothetical protein BD626DRAFT_510293 [Schizophyllum amplum]|uniref:Uncharacterized protein n=1 Tax=Schizophyllum amplum TaxID=97359 RepID=A0A550C1M1_9AGAR|nr:hypothetical protein BD626DRAFT_510293 [Auriculariopsis ampla]
MAFPPLNLPPLPSAPASTSAPAPLSSVAPALPRTPSRGYPVAKPHASRMIHAYSPAQPSPLSRILLLGTRPEDDPFPPIEPAKPMSLAEELGITLSPPSPPAPAPPVRDMKGKGRAPPPPPRTALGGRRRRRRRTAEKVAAPPRVGAGSSRAVTRSSKAGAGSSSRAGLSREAGSKPSSPPRPRMMRAGQPGPRRVPVDSEDAPKLRQKKA